MTGMKLADRIVRDTRLQQNLTKNPVAIRLPPGW
jgi:hypothetical protein